MKSVAASRDRQFVTPERGRNLRCLVGRRNYVKRRRTNIRRRSFRRAQFSTAAEVVWKLPIAKFPYVSGFEQNAAVATLGGRRPVPRWTFHPPLPSQRQSSAAVIGLFDGRRSAERENWKAADA